MNQQQQRLTTIGLVLGLLLCLCVLGFALTRPRANTEIRLVPNDAVLVLDSQTEVKEGTLYITPGKHSIKASRSGFKTVEQTFTTSETTSVKLVFSLVPTNDEGRLYLSKHPEEQAEREEISGEKFNLGLENLAKNYPLTTILPHEGEGFSIHYGRSELNPENPSKIALYIELTTSGYKDRALNWIRYSGYDPQDYEIIYDIEDGRD